MIVPDINLLLYAYDSGSPYHQKAASWWKECLSGTETIGLTHAVVFGFMCVATNARAFRSPMTAAEAAHHVRSWLKQSVVHVINVGSEEVEPVLDLLEKLGTAGNLVTDAQIASIAIAHKAVVHTSDADFLRFSRLKWINPITGASSRS